ncbi:MAG TPA: LssY C-terminal domain-containing protein [Bryobacteraceae bacterium]|nr:LssY C-terminal domain-containing protein [Bryobacteraceae bacterium]
MRPGIFALIALPALAATVPAGTEFSVRLKDKIASESTAVGAAVHADLIAPVVADGKIVIPAGALLSGTVKQVKPANGTTRAEMQLSFTDISMGAYKTKINAVVKTLENARETVDDKGVIEGIDGASTYSSRINQGITKLGGSDRFAGLAGILQGAKQALNIQDANANIDYDAGIEFTLKLTSAADWQGPAQGPEANLKPFPDQAALAGLVNQQPFRTVAAEPPKPSDLTNLMFIATESELRAAFEKAGWATASSLNATSKLETARALIEDRGYKEGPMSVLMLDGNPPALSLQKGNNTFSQRHHLRIFRRDGTVDGKPVWVCSSTHDIGIDFSERDRTFIHKVDPNIDAERAKVVNDLLFTGLVKSLALVDRPQVPTEASNATGDALHTDGRMAVLLF